MVKVKIEIPMPDIDPILKRIGIGHVILISSILRFFIMPFPRDGGKIFDEAHYTGAILKVLEGVHANPEHPPLTKLIVAASVKIFGNHWFAWRFPMVISSLISTYLVYLIAKRFVSERLALLASTFLIFDIIWFIHGNIFMLEPPCMALGLLFIVLYLDRRYNWSAVALSFACLANEKAGFFVLGMAIYHLVARTKLKREIIEEEISEAIEVKSRWKSGGDLFTGFKKLGVFLLIFLVIGVGGLQLVDMVMKPAKATLISHNIVHVVLADQYGVPIKTETSTRVTEEYDYMDNAIEHALWMWKYYSGINKNLVTPEVNFRPAWNWITPYASSISIFNSAKYLVTVVRYGDKQDFLINYRAQTPIFIWYMTIPVIALCIYRYKDDISRFILSWVSASYVPWLVKDIFQRNMPFNHYFQFTLPVICIGIPWFWYTVAKDRWKLIAAVHLVLVIIFFFWFFPVGLRRTM